MRHSDLGEFEKMKTIVDDALEYLKQGFPAIPMSPTDKRPLVKWSEFQERIPSEQETKEMFSKYSKAMIGLVTGKISGICVIDCDSPEACEKIDSMLPEMFEIPIAVSPRGGRHYYFRCPEGLQTKAAVFPQVDVRASGGVIVSPPSINAHGKQYRWLDGLKLKSEALQEMPASLLCTLKGAPLNNNNIYIGGVDSAPLFSVGRRDTDLFTLANSLVKSGMPEADIFRYLDFIMRSWGEHDETWINTKIQSALKRQERRERNLSEEVKDWTLLQTGYFSVTTCYNELQVVTKEQKTAVRVALLRLTKEGLIERHPTESGRYRRIDTTEEIINFLDCPTTNLFTDFKYPFGMETYYRTMPKNEIVIAGCPDSGKTAILLNIAYLNQSKYEIYYFSSEMGGLELRDRLSKFDMPLEQWKTRFIERSSNFADVIRPDAVNIIDYLELCQDTFKVGEYLRAIHDKLKNGIAIIALQKPFGRDLGRGAEFSLEKPRLYLSMEKNQMKIVKCKNWRDSSKNPNGLTIDYKLSKGCNFIPISGWKKPD